MHAVDGQVAWNAVLARRCPRHGGTCVASTSSKLWRHHISGAASSWARWAVTGRENRGAGGAERMHKWLTL